MMKLLRKVLNKLVHSIALTPMVFSVLFLILAAIILELDQQGWGEELNRRVKWLTLKDAATARTIVSTISAGMISLTVFSFSMVMVVFSQAASQMSNRMLDNIIGDRVQKTVLGFYISTIVYSFFLLTTISEVASEDKVPTLSIYLLILVAIFDIFLFIYFLHYITQSFRYEQIIQRIHDRAGKSMKKQHSSDQPDGQTGPEGMEIMAWESGYFQQYSTGALVKLAAKEDGVIHFLYPTGTYVVEGTPFLKVTSAREPDARMLKTLKENIDFYYGQEIDRNSYYGFQHLMEVGIKALSPGINDPGTAVLSLNALTDLLAYKMTHFTPSVQYDGQGRARLFTQQRSFEELFTTSVLPIWDYGKKDRLIQKAVLRMLEQLTYLDKEKQYASLFRQLKEECLLQQEQI